MAQNGSGLWNAASTISERKVGGWYKGAGKAPVFARKPDYSLSTEAMKGTFCVAGEVLAESSTALLMYEGSYDTVYCIPRWDVRLDFLPATDHSTRCPFKGDASYWSITAGGKSAENAVWSYETPFDGVPEIAGTMAFYSDKVGEIVCEG